MILPDLNLLIYAYEADLPQHPAARAWLEDALSGETTVGLPWAVTCGYIRIMTHPRIVARPLRPQQACADVRSWLARPQVIALDPGPRHLEILTELLATAGVAGPLTTDAHLAALAIEHGATLCSNDADFARFPGLRWRNPL